jgi:hypothetical protein
MSWLNGWTSPKETPKEDHAKVRVAFERESQRKNPTPAAPKSRPQDAKVARTESVQGDEVDEVLNDLELIVGELKGQATSMGNELDYHNHLLDRLNTRVENTHMRVRKDNDRIVRLT